MLHRHCLIVTLVAAFSCSVRADVVFVDAANCPGPGDGSELDPFCSIQTAIDDAVASDEIVVAPGTYFETIDFVGKAITLRSSGGPEMTTIDGTSFLHVVQCVSSEGPDTVLDGFTITGGAALGSYPNSVGGGMLNLDSSPTITDCTFNGNSADNGGGMANFFGSSPTITDCTFNGNSADLGSGGGMHNFNNSSPTVTNCRFSENSAFFGISNGGGGMSNNICSPVLTNCTFIGNMSFGPGGGLHNSNGSATITNCTFSGNTTSFFGGGMYNNGGIPTVAYCTFTENGASRGGGMYNNGGIPTVAYCTFIGNSATDDGGGGMFNNISSPVLTNCTFIGNSATDDGGGGMFNALSTPTITNCTFSGNSAANGNALVFDFGSSDLTMTNCILWDGGNEIWNNDGSTVTINYTNVQGGFPGNGNIDADPLFVDPNSGDFRLQAGSPCIDAADNTAVPKGVLRDLDGNPRFVADACAGDSGATVDMGAYEFQGTSCDLGTMMAMLASWGYCGDCRRCIYDFDGDCSVGILDLLILLGNWG